MLRGTNDITVVRCRGHPIVRAAAQALTEWSSPLKDWLALLMLMAEVVPVLYQPLDHVLVLDEHLRLPNDL